MSVAGGHQQRASAPYPYLAEACASLVLSISPDRMETYLRLANGSELRALRLYVRNAALASAFLSPMHILEVTLRNAVHDLLVTEHGDRWYDMVVLTPGQAKAVKQARRGLRQDDKPETPGRMVASLGFGFWVALFTRSNDHPLWRPLLHRAFKPTPPRPDVYRRLDRLRTLRNRIAHHEPIVHRRLARDHDDLLGLLELLSPEVASWARHHSRVPEVLATPVAQLQSF